MKGRTEQFEPTGGIHRNPSRTVASTSQKPKQAVHDASMNNDDDKIVKLVGLFRGRSSAVRLRIKYTAFWFKVAKPSAWPAYPSPEMVRKCSFQARGKRVGLQDVSLNTVSLGRPSAFLARYLNPEDSSWQVVEVFVPDTLQAHMYIRPYCFSTTFQFFK